MITGELLTKEIISRSRSVDILIISDIETISANYDARLGDIWNIIKVDKGIFEDSVLNIIDILLSAEQVINFYAYRKDDKKKFIIVDDGNFMENNL